MKKIILSLAFVILFIGIVNAAWIDSNYKSCNNITYNNGSTSNLIVQKHFNITYINGMKSDFSDVIFISGGCGVNGQNSSFGIVKVNSSNVANFIISINTSENKLGMYYNNSGASSRGNIANTFKDQYSYVYLLSEGTGTSSADNLRGTNNMSCSSCSWTGVDMVFGKSVYTNTNGGGMITTSTLTNYGISGNNPKTLSFWAKQDAVGSGYTLVGLATAASNQNFAAVQILNRWYIKKDGGDVDTGISSNSNLNFHTITYNGTGYSYYINGVNIWNSSATYTLNTVLYKLSTNNIWDGASWVWDGFGATQYITIANRTLTAPEVAIRSQDMNSSSFTIGSQENVTITPPDTTAPVINITYPTNNTVYNPQTFIDALNYTFNETNPSSCWFSVNGGTNISLVCGQNATNVITIAGTNTSVASNSTCIDVAVLGGRSVLNNFVSPIKVYANFSSNINTSGYTNIRIANTYCANNPTTSNYLYQDRDYYNNSEALFWIKSNLQTGWNNYSIIILDKNVTWVNNNTQVWNDYKIVYHFNDGNDSSPESNNFTFMSEGGQYAGIEQNGIFGNHANFNSTSDTAGGFANSVKYLPSDLSGNNPRTFIFYGKLKTVNNLRNKFFDAGTASNNNDFAAEWAGNINQYFLQGNTAGNDWSTGAVADANYNLHIITFDGTKVNWTINGVSIGTYTHTYNTIVKNLTLASIWDGASWVHMGNITLDEFQVLNVSVSSDFVDRVNQNKNSSYVAYSGIGNYTINQTNATINSGTYTYRIYMNDTSGNIGSDMITFFIGVINYTTSSSYLSTDYQYNYSNFTLNVNYLNNTFSSINVYLNYSGVNYPTSSSGLYADKIFSKTLQLNSNGNKDVNWIISLTDENGTYNYSTTTETQYVIPMLHINNNTINESLNFTGNQNITRYLLVPTNIYLTNAYLNLSASSLGNNNVSNINISINNNQVFYYSGNFSQSNNKTNNFASTINTYLSSCTYSGGYCQVPIQFHSNTAGILQYSDTRFDNNGIIQNSQSYNSTSKETKSETFTMNLSYDSNSYSLTPYLIYNGTQYSATKTGIGSNILVSSTINVPTGTGNKSFYWKIGLTNSSGTYYFNSSFNNQTITLLNMSLCNSPYTINFLNFTFHNETTANEIINASFVGSFVYSLSSDYSVNKTFTYSSAVENKNYAFCFTPPEDTIYVSGTANYYNSYSEQRTWINNSMRLTNTTYNKDLLLLPNSESGGIYITFIVQSPSLTRLSNALIDIKKTSGSIPVEQKYTDGTGIAAFWLDSGTAYTVTVTKDGYSTYSTGINPVTSPVTITLSTITSGDGGVSHTPYRGINIRILPKGNELRNNTDYDFTFEVDSGTREFDSYGFSLWNSTSLLDVGKEGDNPDGEELVLTYNTGNENYILMKWYYIIDGNMTNGTKVWYSVSDDGTDFSLFNAFNNLNNDVSNSSQGLFGIKKGNSNGDFTLAIVIFLITFFAAGIMTYKYGITSQTGTMFVIFSIILFFDVGVGILPANLLGSPVPHPITVIVGFITLFLFIKEVNY